MAFVYVHLEADTGNPFYVGMGEKKMRPWQMNHHSRTEWHRNIVKKHGVRVEIVADNLSWDMANIWEIHWIKALRNAGYRLANLTDGGDGTKGLVSQNRKSVLCLETGELFKSAKEAAAKFNITDGFLSECCKGKNRWIDGFHFIHSDTELNEIDRFNKIKEIELICAQRRKKVLINNQINRGIVNGKDVKGRMATGPEKISRMVFSITDNITFPSASEAARYYNIAKSSIIELCLGKNGRKTAGGIMFKYVDGD